MAGLFNPLGSKARKCISWEILSLEVNSLRNYMHCLLWHHLVSRKKHIKAKFWSQELCWWNHHQWKLVNQSQIGYSIMKGEKKISTKLETCSGTVNNFRRWEKMVENTTCLPGYINGQETEFSWRTGISTTSPSAGKCQRWPSYEVRQGICSVILREGTTAGYLPPLLLS